MAAAVANEENPESSDDSVSLLCGFSACQSREAPQDMEVTHLSSAGNNEEKKVEAPSTLTQRTPGCSSAASQSAAFKLPNNINKRSETGETLLHKACKRSDVAQLRLLIQAGICINAEDNAGWTALHEASVVGDAALVEELLKAGANVNARSEGGVTPLHDAVMSGHYEVVKLLLQYGSNATDRNQGGAAAADMTKEPRIKELLQGSTLMPQHHCGTSSETCSQTSIRCNSPADVASRRWRVGAEATFGHAEVQLSNKGSGADAPGSDSLTVLLEELERKQAEMSAWPPAALQDADKRLADLTHVQDVLAELLDKQQVLKDKLVQRSRAAPQCLVRHLLKRQAALLATRQQTLVEVAQKQMDLVKAFVSAKGKLSAQPRRRPRSTGGRRQPDHSYSKAHVCDQNSQKTMEQAAGGLLGAAAGLFKEHQEAPAAAAAAASGTRRKNSLTRTGVQTEEASDLQGNSLKSGTTSTCISFRMKAGDALIQAGAEDSSRRLSELLEGGLVSPGDVLQLRLKNGQHRARVQADGGIKDSKGRVHVALEHWLESILGKNIPVSSAYAWNKVTFRDQPLSDYLLSREAAGPPPQACSEDHADAELRQAASPPEPELTEAATLRLIRNISTIHVVKEEDLMPAALLDRHWEKLLKQECDDW